MSCSSATICNILDIPVEILVKIILHFNARERLALAHSCKKFNNIIFGDEELVKYLDFSKNHYLTTATDIQQYFNNENTRKLVRKVNLRNVKCMKAGPILNNSIGKAMNLVAVNVHGIKFKEVEELESFLQPLVHLKRLSVDWPEPKTVNLGICCNVLQKPLSRLTYLSVKVPEYSGMILPTVQLCEELEELCLISVSYSCRIPLNAKPIVLKNLKIVQFCGLGLAGLVKKDLNSTILDPREWTDFYLVGADYEGYLERNFEVCKELQQVTLMPPPKSILFQDDPEFDDHGFLAENYGAYNRNMGWNVFPEHLLREVIKLTHQDAPKKYCCLNDYKDTYLRPCLLKIDDAKRLLKDPGYKISYLYFQHFIEPDCDAHLVASAFPDVTELVFNRINSRNDSTPNKEKPFQRRLRKIGSKASEELDDKTNLDSSFKMLVENTPNVRRVTIISQSDIPEAVELWDLDALYFISHWKNLRAIRLKQIPIKDGNFLIDIGNECTELEEVQFFNVHRDSEYGYGSALLEMLKHCKNLRKFSISEHDMDNMSEVFIALSNNSKLRTVRVITNTDKFNSLELISSIEQMLHRCLDLTKFVFVVHSALERVVDELRPALERIVDELNRPNFEFHGPVPSGSSSAYQDADDFILFQPFG